MQFWGKRFIQTGESAATGWEDTRTDQEAWQHVPELLAPAPTEPLLLTPAAPLHMHGKQLVS